MARTLESHQEAEMTWHDRIAIDEADSSRTRTCPGLRFVRCEAVTTTFSGWVSTLRNDQWRICFVFTDGDAFDVEFCDYH